MEPREGPQAGGTTLTINGTNLDTGSKEDVRVTIGGVPCNVWVSPSGPPSSGPPWPLGPCMCPGGSGAVGLTPGPLPPSPLAPLPRAGVGLGVGLTLTTFTSRTQFGAQLQCVTGPQAAPGQLSLEIYYGGSLVPSSGITFTYRENPVLRAFEPLRSFARCGLCPAHRPPGLPMPPPPPATFPVPYAHCLVRMWEGWSGCQEEASVKTPLHP